MDLSLVKHKLQEAGVVFDSGLTQGEIQLAEESFGFQFPPDLKSFLMFALPSGQGWPNWRDVDDPELERMLHWPYEGIYFDIQNNSLWPVGWGTKPASLNEALEIAKRKIDEAPKLIPVFLHRYLPDRPSLEGNPVFSVYQSDIIYYGSNLWIYLQNEFQLDLEDPASPRRIEFWSDFTD